MIVVTVHPRHAHCMDGVPKTFVLHLCGAYKSCNIQTVVSCFRSPLQFTLISFYVNIFITSHQDGWQEEGHHEERGNPTVAFVWQPCASMGLAHSAPVVFYETSLGCYREPTVFLLHAYHNVEPCHILRACTKCVPLRGNLGDPMASSGDAKEMLLSSRRPYCMHLGVLHFLCTPHSLCEEEFWCDSSFTVQRIPILLLRCPHCG